MNEVHICPIILNLEKKKNFTLEASLNNTEHLHFFFFFYYYTAIIYTEVYMWTNPIFVILKPVWGILSTGLNNHNKQFSEKIRRHFLSMFGALKERERNVLFNDTLNTFYLWLYGVIYMVIYMDSEKGNPLPPHRLLLSINSKGSFICTIPDRITHTTAFVTPVVEHWLEREIWCFEKQKE